MDNLIQAGRVSRERSRFFLNGVEVPGVQSTQTQYQINLTPLKYLGMDCLATYPKGIQSANFQLSHLVISDDVFLQFTGNGGFNGYLLKDSGNLADNFSFTSGYLTSYSSKCSIGQIPEISVSVVALGNAGRISSGESLKTLQEFQGMKFAPLSFPLKVAGPNNIQINLDDFNTNRVLSYNLDVNVQRNPIYSLGNRFPVDVQINWPIEVVCGFRIDVNDYKAHSMRDFPCLPIVKDLTVSLLEYSGSNTVISYNFKDAFLVGESYETNVNENSIIANLTYKTFITRPVGATELPPTGNPPVTPTGSSGVFGCGPDSTYYNTVYDPNIGYLAAIGTEGVIIFNSVCSYPMKYFQVANIIWGSPILSASVGIGDILPDGITVPEMITTKNGDSQFCINLPAISCGSPFPNLNNLVAYYSMDSGAEPEMLGLDSTSHGYNLTSGGSSTDYPTSVSGKINNAANFTGNDLGRLFLTLTGNSNLYCNSGTGFTMAGWIRLNPCDVTRGYAIRNAQYKYSISSSGVSSFFLSGQTGSATVTGGTIPLDTWCFFINTWDGSGNISTRLNDSTVYSGVLINTPFMPVGGNEFALGGGGENPGFEKALFGNLDEVSFWTGAITPAQKMALYYNGSGFAYPFLN